MAGSGTAPWRGCLSQTVHARRDRSQLRLPVGIGERRRRPGRALSRHSGRVPSVRHGSSLCQHLGTVSSREGGRVKPRIAVIASSYPNSAEPYGGIFNYRRACALANHAEVEVFVPVSTYPHWLPPTFRGYHRVDPAFT